MLRKESEAVSEGNGPVRQEEKIGFGQPALADVYREMRSLSKQEKRLETITILLEQLSECLEHGARQPCLAMDANGKASTKTRERTEGAATAVQAMRGDCFSARRVPALADVYREMRSLSKQEKRFVQVPGLVTIR